MYVGADYYPEHWPRDRWEEDAKLMNAAGFNVVRLAEFAWVFMEPEEGVFEFAWLDDALDLLAKHGISAILCTPTAAMPGWLPRKYPEAMAMRQDGTRTVWGIRKNNCFSNGTYRLLSERITLAMAKRFTDKSNVIGWQTDNEFGHPICYCDTCRAEFQDWLRTRYGSLDELDRCWGTHFWGHTAHRWDEIVIPANEGGHNPSACLDWKRFCSSLNVRFQRDQVTILRKHCPDHFITHNLMGLFKDLDYYDLAADLDFVSWDNYPVWGKPEVRYTSSMAADIMRGLKRKNFWIMEQTAGPPGGSRFGRNPWPGEIRSVAYQQLAHGCDGQVWFRWRTCTTGREQYWHGLLGHDGRPLRRYEEAAQTAREYHKLAKHLAGTTIKTNVAMVYDYDSMWALDIQPGYAGDVYREALGRYYRALFRAGINVDMIRADADVSEYRLLLAPALHMLPDRVADQINRFVRGGGVFLADCRTGVKDEHNRCYERTLPGKLGAALGIEIEEYEAVGDMSFAVVGVTPLKGEYTSEQYIDWITAGRARVMAGYTDWHLEPFAAVTRNRYGKGKGWYVGTVVKEDAFYDGLIAQLLSDAGIVPETCPPPGVEVSVREGQGKRLLFLVNHTDETRVVKIPSGKRELISGRRTGKTIRLDRHGVAVIRS